MTDRRMTQSSTLLLLILALAGCGWGGGDRARERTVPEGPNVLLISIDTLRAGHLGCYGYDRPTSPGLDRFAAQDAILFEDVVNTGGGTLPVHMSMFTSLPPTVHGVWSDDGGGVLPPERVTLAEQLHDAGYATAAFTGGGYTMAKFGFGQGFDSYDDAGGDFLEIMPKAYRWLEQDHARPFFLFLHTYDVHSDWRRLPYDAPEDFNERFTAGYTGTFDGCRFDTCASDLLVLLNHKIQAGEVDPRTVLSPEDKDYMIGLYDGGIAYVDRELQRLFEHLRELDLYDDTIILVTSDHGEEFLEHNLFLHHQNFEEVARVPLLLKLSGGRGGGRRVQGLVTTLEVMPTILDLLDIQPNPEVRGKSLLPLIGGSWQGREVAYMAGGLEKLRGRRWSIIFGQDRPVRLYDLAADPAEQVDRLAEEPELVASLVERYRAIRTVQLQAHAILAAGRESPRAQLSPEDVEHLRALGYLQ